MIVIEFMSKGDLLEVLRMMRPEYVQYYESYSYNYYKLLSVLDC